MISGPPLQPAVEAIANFYGQRGRTPIGTLSGLYSLQWLSCADSMFVATLPSLVAGWMRFRVTNM
jgi:hypothetical protein